MPRPSVEPTTEVVERPGPGDHLPQGAAEGADWQPAEGRLAQGIAVGTRFPDDDQLHFRVTEPFGRRPMPPGGPGIETETLAGDVDDMTLLVTTPTFGEPSVWGEQLVLVLRRDAAGWRLAEAWRRSVCVDRADRAVCR